MTGMIRHFALLLVVSLGLVLPSVADQRSIYTVQGIEVDVVAETAQLAEQEAFAEAKQEGLKRLVNKLSLPEDRANAVGLVYSRDAAEALAAAVDVIEEKRAVNVYRGELAIVFNPTRVRTFLNAAQLPFVDIQGNKELMVPVARDTSVADMWIRAWPEQDRGALVPYETALALYGPGSNWDALMQEAQAIGVQSAIVAELIGEPETFRVRLTRVTPAGRQILGTTNRVVDIDMARLAASAYLDTIHKRQSIVRSDERTKTTATVLYSNVQEWNDLRSALARSALVSDFKVDAVARDGAVVTFLYAGDVQRLSGELRRRGVQVDPDPAGWVLTSTFSAGQ